MQSPRQSRVWMLVSVPLALGAVAGSVAARDASMGKALHLLYGILAAALLSFAALLGLRKRWLRLRVGSVAAWTSAHNWLGGLCLFFALLHARLRPGGGLAAALLVVLSLSVLTGVVGFVIQSVVPRLMSSRLSEESPRRDLRPAFAEHWRGVHEIVASACGARPAAEEELRAFELACGIRGAWPAERKGSHRAPAATEGQSALAGFYRDIVVPFFRAPLSRHPRLSSEADATLTFDALRGEVDPSFHEAVDRIREILRDARQRAEEARLRKVLEGWALFHIPLSMMTLVLTVAHAFAALYY